MRTFVLVVGSAGEMPFAKIVWAGGCILRLLPLEELVLLVHRMPRADFALIVSLRMAFVVPLPCVLRVPSVRHIFTKLFAYPAFMSFLVLLYVVSHGVTGHVPPCGPSASSATSASRSSCAAVREMHLMLLTTCGRVVANSNQET